MKDKWVTFILIVTIWNIVQLFGFKIVIHLVPLKFQFLGKPFYGTKKKF